MTLYELRVRSIHNFKSLPPGRHNYDVLRWKFRERDDEAALVYCGLLMDQTFDETTDFIKFAGLRRHDCTTSGRLMGMVEIWTREGKLAEQPPDCFIANQPGPVCASTT